MMDSFSKRRPPKFSQPIDFSNLVDRLSDLFSGGWSTNNTDSSTNTANNIDHHGLYSSNLAHATGGINSNPFHSKGMNSFDFNAQWINPPPLSCPPIGTRDSFNSFSMTPRNQSAITTTTTTNNNNHFATTISHDSINSHYYSNSTNNNLNRSNKLHNNYAYNLTNGHYQKHQQFNPINNTNNYPIGSNHLSMTNNNNNIGNSNNLSSGGGGNLPSYVPPRVRRRNPTCTECVFCKNNGQPPEFYKGHILKCPEGKIICPILREYNCPICNNGGGEKAHTLRYCPWNKPSFWQRANRS